MLKLSSPKYLSKIVTERIVEHRRHEGNKRVNSTEMNDFVMTMLLHLDEVTHIASNSHFATFEDAHENIGCY